MKKIILILIGGLLTTCFLYGQKHDYIYIEQDDSQPPAVGIKLTFSDSLNGLNIDTTTVIGQLGWSPTLADKEGNFLCFSNTYHLYDDVNRLAINGNRIAPGYTLNYRINNFDYHLGRSVHQGSAFFPITDSIFILIHSSYEDWPGAPDWDLDVSENGNVLGWYSAGIYYSELRLRADGRMEVTSDKKKIRLLEGTFLRMAMTFVKHANGKDWWIIVPEHYTENGRKLLLRTDSGEIELKGSGFFSKLNDRFCNFRVNVPSPNGKYVATYINLWWDGYGLQNKLEIKKFDRCTGNFELLHLDSFPLAPNYIAGTGDVAWSDDGRFLYVALGEFLLQMDMHTDNPFDNIDTVYHVTDPVIYAGFLPEAIEELWRLPNGEILVVSVNSTPYLSYIRKPHLKGEACQFEYVTDTLPPDLRWPDDNLNITIKTLPSYPPYRMPPLEYDCETSVDEPSQSSDVFISLYPNPAWAETTVQIHGAQIKQARMLDINGRQVLETEGHGRFDVSTLPSGVYFVEVETDRGVFVRKLIVQ